MILSGELYDELVSAFTTDDALQDDPILFGPTMTEDQTQVVLGESGEKLTELCYSIIGVDLSDRVFAEMRRSIGHSHKLPTNNAENVQARLIRALYACGVTRSISF